MRDAVWISPIVRHDPESNILTVIEPPELAGRIVVAVDGQPCARAHERTNWAHPADLCGLIEGHNGAHWQCAAELVIHDGPFALVRA